ncbi:Methyltransferase_TRM13 [Hexamita inflata]|uniref:tRNA:m(4)X modification enzyme TRM13 n=1 Tax=Hexamita inflata TaxID=28002 RepID=A0AA86Q4Y5_9EUKA|nr:Methyltransferase TRM13 [Hexamita inflata]
MKQCPYDPKHQIREDHYWHHVNHCDKRPEMHPSFGLPFYQESCAIMNSQLHSDAQQQSSVSQLTLDQLPAVFEQINVLYSKFASKYSSIVQLFYQPTQQLDCEISLEANVSTTDRHAKQIKSLVQHIINRDLLNYQKYSALDQLNQDNNFLLLEAGSGTGELSAFLANAVQFKSENTFKVLESWNRAIKQQRNSNNLIQVPSNNLIFALVERETGYKIKYDYLIRQSGAAAFRIVCDLRDLKIENLINWPSQKLFENYQQLFNSKIQIQNEEKEPQKENIPLQKFKQVQSNYQSPVVSIIGKHLCGGATDCVLNYATNIRIESFVIALCCHCKSDGHSYINQQLFKDLGVSREMLELIHRTTTWQFAFKGQQCNALQEQKKETGFKARVILDVGRVLWLQENGYDVDVVKYCEETESDECWALIAQKTK